MENGQVVIVCRNTEIVDVIVEKLNAITDKGIRSCHSYNDVETAVKFNWVHPRASIPIDVVQKILTPHGEVIRHTAVKDQSMPVYTGAHIFIMRTEDLQKKPLPLYANICGFRTDIHYKNRKKVCWECKSPEHEAQDCPNKKGCWECGSLDHQRSECPDVTPPTCMLLISYDTT